jgi:phosphopantetheinyl transferase
MQVYILEINDISEYKYFDKANTDLVASSFLTKKEASFSRLMYLTCAYILKNNYAISAPIKLEKNKKGKPYVEQTDIELSFSHSATHIAFTISSTQIGIDIEKIRNLPRPLLQYFKNNFQNILYDNNEAINQISYWTTLEALSKAIQVGVYDLLLHASVEQNHINYRKMSYVKRSFLISDTNILSVIELGNSNPAIDFYHIQPDEIKSKLKITPFSPINI